MASQIILKNGQNQEFSITHPDNVGAININSNELASKDYVDVSISNLDVGVPTGVILLWSGSIASIPAGWALCNGANGTPDLRDRFVVGAGSTYNVGVTGGSKDAIVVEHAHTGTTASSGAHVHTIGVARSGSQSILNYGGGADSYVSSVATSAAGAYSSSITTNSTGSSGTNANLPPYYALAYIMKI